MTQTADVLIIGAGVMGASAAWHLTQRGVRRVVLLDRAPGPGLGSTGRATGGYRGQFSTEPNIRLSLRSREKLRRFRDEVGTDPQYRPVGYLFLCSTTEQLAQFRRSRAVQRDLGLYEATEIAADELHVVNPHATYDGIIGASWCPSDGTIRPLEILRGYLEGAERAGAVVHWNADVVSVTRDADGRLTSVHTASGEHYAAPHVINATGAWAGSVAALAGVEIPVVPARRQIAVAVGHGLPDTMAMTIWVHDGFHLRIRDGHALLNWPVDSPSDDPYSLHVDPAWVDATWAKARARVPAMAHAQLDASAHWAGLYEMSPDKTVLFGYHPACPNLLLMNGSSGHGVMHSPALGELAAEWLVDGSVRSMDVRALRPTRFAEGDPNPVNDLL
ncbi:MAG: FAD-dependent oxidoreductase [Gemmatimonadaceae bacterium]|nr:FAD-dependent oxidoreductase [Gemmatimonadaceae bacterium]